MSRIALLALLNCWALIGGVALVGGALAGASSLMGIVFPLFVVMIGGVVLMAYRKDRLSAWNAWVEEGATQHSMLILLAAIASSVGGILLLQHCESPESAAAWVLNLSALVGALETATIIMAMIGRRKGSPTEDGSP
jgi:hypothetical protein